MIRKNILYILLTLCSFETAHAQGLDLNPGLLGCILSEGDCLINTGIPVIDRFFRAFFDRTSADPYTHADKCYDFEHHWCGTYGAPLTGFDVCKEAKKTFYKQQAIKMGNWLEGQQPGNYRMIDDEYNFAQVERQKRNPHYFECNVKQREIFIKAHCGNKYSIDWGALSRRETDCDDDED